MGKKLSALAFCLLLLGCCAGCADSQKQRAREVLVKNQNALTVLAEGILETGTIPEESSIPGVADISYLPGWVEFTVGGRGLVPSASYYGLYYSSENVPLSYQAAEMELAPEGRGWSWREAAGDNRYYTEPLQDCWFYYAMDF